MRKFLLVLFLASLFLISPLTVNAVTITNPLENINTFQDLIERLVNFLYTVALYTAPLLIVIGGYFILFSGGSPERVTKGRKIIFWTVLGFAIVLLADALVKFVLKNVLEITN